MLILVKPFLKKEYFAFKSNNRMSKIESKSTIVVNQNLEKSFQYTCEPLHTKEWYSNVIKSERDTTLPIQIGTHATLLTDIMGKKYDFDYVITEYIPLEKMRMTAETGSFPMESEYLFKKINDNQTEITVINRAEPKNVPFFLIGMVKSKVQQTMNEDVQTLKTILEKL